MQKVLNARRHIFRLPNHNKSTVRRDGAHKDRSACGRRPRIDSLMTERFVPIPLVRPAAGRNDFGGGPFYGRQTRKPDDRMRGHKLSLQHAGQLVQSQRHPGHAGLRLSQRHGRGSQLSFLRGQVTSSQSLPEKSGRVIARSFRVPAENRGFPPGTAAAGFSMRLRPRQGQSPWTPQLSGARSPPSLTNFDF